MCNGRHKHADLIIAWANGAQIQVLNTYDGKWYDVVDEAPLWKGENYRIKPEPKPDIVKYARVNNIGNLHQGYSYDSHKNCGGLNVRAVFDGETGDLKDVKVIK